jgi:uncharacterized membrane protein
MTLSRSIDEKVGVPVMGAGAVFGVVILEGALAPGLLPAGPVVVELAEGVVALDLAKASSTASRGAGLALLALLAFAMSASRSGELARAEDAPITPVSDGS